MNVIKTALGNVCLCVCVHLVSTCTQWSNQTAGKSLRWRAIFLISWDNLICMLFIVHESPAHYSSQHTHMHRPVNIVNTLISWFDLLTQAQSRLTVRWIICGEQGKQIRLTSWPGIWTRCRSAWQTHQRSPAAPHRSKPSTHHLPESLGFLPRRLPPHQLRSERCSTRREVEETNISGAQRTKWGVQI